MDKILIFAGTTEGRMLAEFLNDRKVACHICVATEYGEALLMEGRYMKIHQGRLDEKAMEELMDQNEITMVIDATHPYAAVVSENIKKACRSREYIRVYRETAGEDVSCIRVDSVQKAAEFLAGTKGNVLVTTGSKELSAFTSIEQYKERIYARVLPAVQVVEDCKKMGFEGKHLICMQGPFLEELNYAMLKQINASYLVTKDSGKQGGFEEKAISCKRAGAQMILIGRPTAEEGISVEKAKEYLANRWNLKAPRKVALIGIGMGGNGQMTRAAWESCREAQVLFGAERIVDSVKELEKPVQKLYLGKDIKKYLQENPNIETAAVLMSGDIGFYSGAKKLYEELKEFEVHPYPGIASPVYFCGMLGTSWEDVKLMSLHGRKQNLIGAVKRNKKVFTLLGTKDTVRAVCEKLLYYKLDSLEVTVGEHLSYENERIVKGSPKELKEMEFAPLSVMLIENPKIDRVMTQGISDECFQRGKVPMTKEEIRSISLSKLKLTRDAVAYDVGAGTGSVSIEMALLAKDGQVYAVEKKEEAVELLKANKEKFGADNLTIIPGLAPQALENLPAPTHVFIGGSSGNLKEIMSICLHKNPRVHFVINAIALETVAEALECMKVLPVTDTDIVTAAIGRSKEVGKYHMMMGLNPVTILSCRGGEAPWEHRES